MMANSKARFPVSRRVDVEGPSLLTSTAAKKVQPFDKLREAALVL
jgi:hypothetical protein